MSTWVLFFVFMKFYFKYMSSYIFSKSPQKRGPFLGQMLTSIWSSSNGTHLPSPLIFHLDNPIPVWIVRVILWCSVDFCYLSKSTNRNFHGLIFFTSNMCHCFAYCVYLHKFMIVKMLTWNTWSIMNSRDL